MQIEFQALDEKDGLYRLRAFVQALDGKETSFLTFVKAVSFVGRHISILLPCYTVFFSAFEVAT
jgi:hypothetical protein